MIKVENNIVVMNWAQYHQLVSDNAGICTKCGELYYLDVPLAEPDCHCPVCVAETVLGVELAWIEDKIEVRD